MSGSGTLFLYFIPALLIVLVYLTPFVLVARSEKVSGNEKLAWLVAMFFISWFAWILFVLLAPIKPDDNFRV